VSGWDSAITISAAAAAGAAAISLLSVIPVIAKQALAARRQHRDELATNRLSVAAALHETLIRVLRTREQAAHGLDSASHYSVRMRKQSTEITIRVSVGAVAVKGLASLLPRVTSGTETDPIVARSEQESKVVSNILRSTADDLQDQANKIIVKDIEAAG
jgi:hypothetical protein